ncbi:MAG TPA: sodium:solute symporter family protein, partial [Verrucomicrobiae bacterium]|nr:sodium:solute symporter family protein [Verrucomicrobiae bacterium]
MLTTTHYLAVAVTLLIVSLAGIYSVKFIRTAEDFAVGGRNMGPGMIAGSLVGSFVGGTSTIGTAQLAYRTGISAVWFTLGAGLACLVLGVWLAKPLREAEVDTIPQFLRLAYGNKVTVWAGCYTFLGVFIQIMAQILAFIPLVTSLAPIAPTVAAGLAAGLILLYVIFGGFWGTSLVGFVKLILLYTVLLAGGLISYFKLGGLTGIQHTFSAGKTLSLFPQGVAHNLADGFSVIIGFISTQTYLQAVFAGKNPATARKGVFITAALLPVIGVVCSLIGLYMREVEPNIPSA